MRLFQRVALSFAVLAAGVLQIGTAGGSSDQENDLGDRISALRRSAGITALVFDPELATVARNWSARMSASNTLGHNPNLTSQVPPNWEKVSENVGAGADVEAVHQAFSASASHRGKMLEAAMTHVGVGVVTDASGKLWVTQVFMKVMQEAPAAQQAPPQPSPAPRNAEPPQPGTEAPSEAAEPPRRSTAGAAGAAPAARPSRSRRTATTPRVRPPSIVPAAPEPVAEPVEVPAAEPPPPAPEPSPRLILVLEKLRALDGEAGIRLSPPQRLDLP